MPHLKSEQVRGQSESGGEANFANDHFTDYFANNNFANLSREVKKGSVHNEQRPEGQYVSEGSHTTTVRTKLGFRCQKPHRRGVLALFT